MSMLRGRPKHHEGVDMIINSIIAGAGGGGTPANMRTYNITSETRWGEFIGDCNFQLRYKNSTILMFVTGATAPSAGMTTTMVYLTHLGNDTMRSQWIRNAYNVSGDLRSPDYVNSDTVRFSTMGTSANNGYWAITSAGILTVGGSSIGSYIPTNATVTIVESPLSDDAWGT